MDLCHSLTEMSRALSMLSKYSFQRPFPLKAITASVVSVLCVQIFLPVAQMICLLCRRCSSQWTTCPSCNPDTVFTRTQPACGGFVCIKSTVEWWETVPDSSSHLICSYSTHHISWIPSPTLWMGWCPSAQPHSSDRGLLPGSDHLSIITIGLQIP